MFFSGEKYDNHKIEEKSMTPLCTQDYIVGHPCLAVPPTSPYSVLHSCVGWPSVSNVTGELSSWYVLCDLACVVSYLVLTLLSLKLYETIKLK